MTKRSPTSYTLEWCSFALAAFSALAYGEDVLSGAVLGMMASGAFLIWAATDRLLGVGIFNVFFLAFHMRNFVIAPMV